jgi:hypothetical protein
MARLPAAIMIFEAKPIFDIPVTPGQASGT